MQSEAARREGVWEGEEVEGASTGLHMQLEHPVQMMRLLRRSDGPEEDDEHWVGE